MDDTFVGVVCDPQLETDKLRIKMRSAMVIGLVFISSPDLFWVYLYSFMCVLEPPNGLRYLRVDGRGLSLRAV